MVDRDADATMETRCRMAARLIRPTLPQVNASSCQGRPEETAPDVIWITLIYRIINAKFNCLMRALAALANIRGNRRPF